MEKQTIFIYPGFVTKGLKGRILWHPSRPGFDEEKGDWPARASADITECVNDPWPSTDGGPGCILEVGSPK